MTASSHNFSESHTYDDIVRAHAADPQSINWNAGQLAQLVLGKHDMRSFQFLLDCVDFKWRYAVTDVTRSCVNVTGYWFDECETCKKGRLSRSSNEDDRWLKEAFAFHYDVFCRVIECDRLLEHGRFVHDMMFTMARYTVALAPIVYARLQPRHWIDMIQGANAYIPSVYVASNIKHYAPDVIARLDVEFCKSTDKEGVFFIDRYPWRIESHTRKMLNPIVCAIRLTEVRWRSFKRFCALSTRPS